MQPLLKVQGLGKQLAVRAGLLSHKKVSLLKDISFCIGRGETLAVIGETGAGKSTLAKVLAGADEASSGQIILESDLVHDGTSRHGDCRHIRLIFQDPTTSLNPALTIGEILDDCLRLNTELSSEQRLEKIKQTLAKVGLLVEHRLYYPHMFSGGQLQRVALARALILDPKVLVLDEALSSLDPSVRAQTVNLLLELQRETGLSYVLITHHLSLVKHMSDQVLVLDHGGVVEYGKTDEIFGNPQSKTCQRLLTC